MTVYVKADPTAGQSRGDWVVTTDGGQTISRHRKKKRAMSKAKSEARSRGTNVKYQNSGSGQWNQGPSY